MSDKNFEDYNELFVLRGLLSRTLQHQYFWSGNLTNCIRYYPEQGIFFGIKNKFKFLLNPPNKNNVTISFKEMFVGCIAGLAGIGFFYHVDYVWIRLANDTTNQFSGIYDVYEKTLSSNGISGLYHGFLFYCVSTSVFRFFYYILFNELVVRVMNNQALGAIFFIMPVAPIALFLITGISAVLSHPFMIIQKQMIITSQGVIEASSHVINDNYIRLWNDVGATFLKVLFGQTLLVAISNISSIIRFMGQIVKRDNDKKKEITKRKF